MVGWGEEKPNGEFWMLDFGFFIEFSIQHLKFKILPWSQGFSELVLTIEVRIF
jgi:hypothetical protein